MHCMWSWHACRGWSPVHTDSVTDAELCNTTFSRSTWRGEGSHSWILLVLCRLLMLKETWLIFRGFRKDECSVSNQIRDNPTKEAELVISYCDFKSFRERRILLGILSHTRTHSQYNMQHYNAIFISMQLLKEQEPFNVFLSWQP